MNDLTLTVTQLNNYAKSILEQDQHLKCCMVVGEISNFTNHYRSGHLYMSLKDDTSSIKAVMFKTQASKLKFIPENGMKILCRGRVSIYDRDGQYQLYIDEIIPDGVGALGVAFRQLKEKLEKEGLFSVQHKKPIPLFPTKIGVITSPTGAAVRDIVNVLSRRYPCCEMMVFPVQVQGDSSAPQMIKALKLANNYMCDVIIIGRGGGSAEDLWAFNDEGLAREIYSSKVPVISAVGHETDFTICDFAADLRAPTPSAGAELAVPDISELIDLIEGFKLTLNYDINLIFKNADSKLKELSSNRYLINPEQNIIDPRSLYFDNVSYKFLQLNKEYITEHSYTLQLLKDKLYAFSPLENLKRGYSVATKDDNVITSVNDININEQFCLELSDGRIQAVRKE